jgi:hypothetical protein
MDVRLEMVLPQAASEFAKLPTPVRSLLRLCDGTRTLDAICGSGALPPDQAQKVISRLVQLGLVATRAAERKRSKTLSARTLQWLRTAERSEVLPLWGSDPSAERLAPGDDDGFSHDEEAFFASSVEHLIEA